MMKVLWLVTARSGSKSVPDKNIKMLGGKPLLAHRITSALETGSGEVWLSTDSEKYAEIGSAYGAHIPFLRPAHLATDSASSADVVLHAMEYATSQGKSFDLIGLLEPTSPFITAGQLMDGVAKLSESSASAIVAVKEHRPHTIFVQDDSDTLAVLYENLKTLKALGRQHFKKQITPSGGFYISWWEAFLENNTFYNRDTLPYIVDEASGLEIDEPIDWEFAEFIFEKRIKNTNEG